MAPKISFELHLRQSRRATSRLRCQMLLSYGISLSDRARSPFSALLVGDRSMRRRRRCYYNCLKNMGWKAAWRTVPPCHPRTSCASAVARAPSASRVTSPRRLEGLQRAGRGQCRPTAPKPSDEQPSALVPV